MWFIFLASEAKSERKCIRTHRKAWQWLEGNPNPYGSQTTEVRKKGQRGRKTQGKVLARLLAIVLITSDFDCPSVWCVRPSSSLHKIKCCLLFTQKEFTLLRQFG